MFGFIGVGFGIGHKNAHAARGRAQIIEAGARAVAEGAVGQKTPHMLAAAAAGDRHGAGLVGDGGVGGVVENHGAQGDIGGGALVFTVFIDIGKSSQALAVVGGAAIIIGIAVNLDLHRANIHRRIEAHSFGAREAQKIGHLLGLPAHTARGEPLAHIGQRD